MTAKYSTPGAINVDALEDGNTLLKSATASTTYAPKASPVFTGTVGIPTYTLTTLPAVVVGAIIIVTDATTSAGLCVGAGASWIDVKTGVAVA